MFLCSLLHYGLVNPLSLALSVAHLIGLGAPCADGARYLGLISPPPA